MYDFALFRATRPAQAVSQSLPATDVPTHGTHGGLPSEFSSFQVFNFQLSVTIWRFSGFQFSNCQISNFQTSKSNSKFKFQSTNGQTSKFKIHLSNFKFQIPYSNSQASKFKLQISYSNFKFELIKLHIVNLSNSPIICFPSCQILISPVRQTSNYQIVKLSESQIPRFPESQKQD